MPARNPFLDSLRGLAIVLMVVDHAAGLLFQTPIDFSTVRLGTRLSMPLFAVLMGYFLPLWCQTRDGSKRGRSPLRRIGEIGIAALATNLLYFSVYGVFDILLDLVVCTLIYWLLGNRFMLLCVVILAYRIDPSIGVFDYPLSIVLSLVAVGVVLRLSDITAAVVIGIAVTIGGLLLISPPSMLVVLFTVPATALVAMASQSKGINVPPLAWLGRHSLAAYVVQYYVLFGIAALADTLPSR